MIFGACFLNIMEVVGYLDVDREVDVDAAFKFLVMILLCETFQTDTAAVKTFWV